MGVRRRDRGDQRQALGVSQDVELGAGFAAVNRIRPYELTPLFARTEAESTKAADQSILPAARTQPVKDLVVEVPPQAGSCPGSKSAVRSGRAHAEARRQATPSTRRGQRIHDHAEHFPVRHRSRSTALPTRLERWYQRCRNLPQPVRNEFALKIHSHGWRSRLKVATPDVGPSGSATAAQRGLLT